MKKTKTNSLLSGIFIFLLAFFIFYFGRYLQLIPIHIFNIKLPVKDVLTFTLLNFFSNIIILLVLVYLFKKPMIDGFKKLKNDFMGCMDRSFKIYFLGLFGMMISNLFINLILKGGGANNEKMVQSMISSAPIFMIISAGIIAPVIEELVFRQSMRGMFRKKWSYILASGILFGGMHVVSSFNNIIDLLYIIPYSSLGIAFAYMDFKEDNIYPSILMHMLHNTALTILSILL